MDGSVAIIGVGPHARRIYFSTVKKAGAIVRVVVELESARARTKEYLDEAGLNPALYFIDETDSNDDTISPGVQADLDRLLRKEGVTHAIVSTEARAHLRYIRFLLDRGIHTLTDKPVTAPQYVSTDTQMAERIWRQFVSLAQEYRIAKKRGLRAEVLCQRRYHLGYKYVRDLLKYYVREYQVPITHLDVYHCDGVWNMPNEFVTRDNHPYKYGYGKLFHSGYHFIDVMLWLLISTGSLALSKATAVELYSTVVRPSTFLTLFDRDFYSRLFPNQGFDTILGELTAAHAKNFGELDFYGVAQFRREAEPITTCAINLLQSGFSRRSWLLLPEDTYKGNGRVSRP